MKLTQLIESHTQIVHMKFARDRGLEYTFVLHPMGVDGNLNKVYMGNCNIHNSAPTKHDPEDQHIFAGVVFSPDGHLMAAQYWEDKKDAMVGAALAVKEQRRAYGPHPRKKFENWVRYLRTDVEVEGYEG